MENSAHMISLLNSQLPTMTRSNLAQTITILGQLQDKLKLVGFLEKKILIQTICRAAHELTPYEISQVLVAMTRLNFKYSYLENSPTFWQSLQNTLVVMSHKSLGDALWALGALGTSFVKLPISLQLTILASITKNSEKFDLYQLPSILWALAKMGMKWAQLHDADQKNLLNTLSNVTPQLSSAQSSKILWSLGSLGISVEQLPVTFLNTYLSNVNDLKKSKIGDALTSSQTLTGLAKMNVKWEYLNAKCKSIIWEQTLRICQSNNNQGLSNAIWALGSIGELYISTKLYLSFLYLLCMIFF
jgi:hypothetical protein